MVPYSCACNVEHFADHEFVAVLRATNPHLVAGDARFPAGREYRKDWEVAMAVRALRDHGALRPDAEILGVAAGLELTTFVLTNEVRRVFATDLYLGDRWRSTADKRMLIDPTVFAAVPWKRRRLVVQHMDARDLQYDDQTFDGVFSSSSLEHVGSTADARRVLEEMCRVLRPGGVVSMSTELRLAGASPGYPGTLLFDRDELLDLIADLPAQLVGDLDDTVSAATRASVTQLDAAVRARKRGREWSYPHIVLRRGQHLFTSVHLTLVKPKDAPDP